MLCTLHANENADLLKANTLFRDIYRERKEQALATLDPVIISCGGKLTLISNQRREAVVYIPDNYHRLK